MKAFLVRLISYIISSIIMFCSRYFFCSNCSVGDKWCLSSVGYGGINLLAIIKWIVFIVVIEIIGYLVVKIFKINNRNVAVIIILIFSIIILYPFNNSMEGCAPCAIAYDCKLEEKGNKYICKFSDDEKEYEIKCSFENYKRND